MVVAFYMLGGQITQDAFIAEPLQTVSGLFQPAAIN